MESSRSLDVHSWLVVVTFMAVIALVIHPIRIPLPIPSSHPSHSSSQDTLSAVGTPATPAQETPSGPGTNNSGVHGKKRRHSYPYHFTLDIATAPVLGVLLLWAIGSITVDSVRDGIVGNPANGVEPYAVMILFFSLVRRPSLARKKKSNPIPPKLAHHCVNPTPSGMHQWALLLLGPQSKQLIPPCMRI